MAASSIVRNLLGRICARSDHSAAHPARPAGILETGDFRIDLVARQAALHGCELDLSSSEFDLLVFLANHPNRVVTPRTLLATDWGGHAVRQVEFLRVLLSLRRKIAAVDNGKHYLRTEPWVFYRFSPNGS